MDLLQGEDVGHGKGTRFDDRQGNTDNMSGAMMQAKSSMKGAATMMNKDPELVAIGKELVSLLNAIFIVSVCIFFVLMVILIVTLVK